MDSLAKPKNRALFLVSVAVTGAFAGAAVWLFFFAMEHGIDYLWTEIPHALGVTSPELASGPFGFLPYPFFVCLLGGLLIGLYEKLTGTKTDDLNQVMAKVKQDGRYPYDNLGKLSLAALLPLLFGGSIGPEAGLTGVIAGLCSWVGDRMRRFGAEFRELTLLGTQAALTALFTAPVFGFVAPLAGSADGQGANDDESASDEITIKLPQGTEDHGLRHCDCRRSGHLSAARPAHGRRHGHAQVRVRRGGQPGTCLAHSAGVGRHRMRLAVLCL